METQTNSTILIFLGNINKQKTDVLERLEMKGEGEGEGGARGKDRRNI